MSGRPPGSRKCAQCGWIHMPDGPCKPVHRQVAIELRDQRLAMERAVHPPQNAPGTHTEAPGQTQGAWGSTRAAIDMRMLQNRQDWLEARQTLLEARIQKLEQKGQGSVPIGGQGLGIY